MQGADAVVIMTEWNEFRALDLAPHQGAAAPARSMVDLRNVYNPAEMQAAGFDYRSIGRPTREFSHGMHEMSR